MNPFGLFRVLTQRFPAPHLVQHHRIHLFKTVLAGPHDNIGNPTVDNHLGAEEAGPDLGDFVSLNIKSGQIESTPPGVLPCLEKRIHLSMNASAPFVI